MVQTLARIVALLTFAAIVFATLSTLNLRPRSGYVSLEREAAFFMLGLALTIGYPTQTWLVALALLVSTCGLEIAQNLTPDRHGELVDALQKLGGAFTGLAVGFLANRLLAR